MTKKEKNYKKDLIRQMNEILQSKLAFGESKQKARRKGTLQDKIFSGTTLKVYKQQCKKFCKWIDVNHQNCNSIKHARKYVAEYLDELVGNGYAASSVQTASKALNKLFNIDVDDPDYYHPPVRRRVDFTRSRVSVEQDKLFSEANNFELVQHCKAYGPRRSDFKKITGSCLTTKEEIMKEIIEINKQIKIDKQIKLEIKKLKELLKSNENK